MTYMHQLLGLTLLALLPSCWQQSAPQKQGLVVINVLDKELYDDCHIKGSMNIPFEKVDQLAEQLIKMRVSNLLLKLSMY